MNVLVMKFGGSILRRREDYERVADIVVEELGRNHLPLCVVSAMKGVTDSLIKAVNTVQYNIDFKPSVFVEGLRKEHIKALPSNEEDPQPLTSELDKLEHILSYIQSSKELSDSAYAYAVSRGESFSSQVLSRHLEKKGVSNRAFGGEDLLVTNENSREADINLDKTKRHATAILKPLIAERVVPIVAGFAGRSASGKVTIMGRGGSDDTAVCLAYCMDVDRVIKYVDEDGIMNIDPKFIENVKTNSSTVSEKFGGLSPPQVISYLSYVEASELLREERTKIVHFKVLTPLMKGNILLHIKNIYKSDGMGTVIGPENEFNHARQHGRPKAISYQRNLYGIRFLPTQSLTHTEVYAKVFDALAREQVDVRYLSTSGYQISLLMPKSDVERALRALKKLDIAMDVAPIDGKKGTFSIIGSGMRGVHGFFSRVTGVFAEHSINIEQATQPNSENIIRFSVDDEDIPLAVSALYARFFG